ncbi:MAG: YihY family inner membrane protein [Thermomonas sp.]|uniref:YihY family inner membrane protein n=1 Tax=Thermomonas sp. TaxID=1971895 RepID=UPI0039E486BD
MEPLDTLNRWSMPWRDRARAGSFGRFVLGRFLRDNLLAQAGALSYTTVFALVPLSMVVFGVLSAFPVFDVWSDRLSDYIFANFVPRAASAVQGYLREFSANTRELTTVGVIALVLSLLITLNSVESIFNRIWRVPTARPKFGRFLVYWTVLTLGALVAATSLALSTRFFALAIFETVPGRWLEALLLRFTPTLIELFAFAAIFKVVPHRTVQWRHALAGAALSVLLFECVKGGIGLYLGSFGSYQKIYGPLAFVPVFLLWIYLGWTAVLFGASFASSLSAFRYQPAALRLPHGYELYGLLRVLGRFNAARAQGRGLHSEEIQRLEPILTDSLVQELLGKMAAINVVSRAEGGQWLLARDLDDVTLGELYEAANLRVPVAEARLPNRDDALGDAVMQVIDGLRLPLREQLKLRVSSIFEDLPKS